MKKVAVFALFASLALLMCAATGWAAEVAVSNRLDIRVSVTVSYYDKETGALTTKGWWHVEPGGSAIVDVNADETRGIYYAAYNKDLFIDSGTRGNEQIVRAASPRNFEYTGDDHPTDDGVWQARYYKIDGTSVNIDGKPHGN